jgi:hypothetical protein
MAPLNVRNNNPGNLKSTDLATAKRFWGDRVQGVDGRGLGIFKDPEAGRSALEQQLKIDSSRGLNLKDFINKYVGAEADPQGTANAHQNLPKLLGVSPDTLISDIDFNKLIRAVTENEGGRDSVRHFFPDSDNRLQNGITAIRPDDMNPASDDEMRQAEAMKAMADVTGPNPLITTQTKPDLMDILLPNRPGSGQLRGMNDTPSMSAMGINGERVPSGTILNALGAREVTPENAPAIGRGLDPAFRKIQGIRDLQQSGRAQVQLGGGAQVQLGGGAPSTPVSAPNTTPQPAAKTAVAQATPTSTAPAGAGGFDLGALLKKLGGAALSNTGLTALGIGAQGIGGIMQGRAQSKADKGARRQQSTNNAIAAFMGGQAAQAAPRQANSTGGNILSALGQTLGGVANARRADQATKFDQDLETRKLDAIEGRNNAMIEVAKLQAGKQGDDEAAELQGQFDIMNKTLTELQEVHAEGGAFTTGSLAFFKLPSSLGGDRQAYLEALGNSLMGPLNSVHRLGRLSDKDIEILRKSIPTWDDGGPTVAAKVAAVRKLIEFSKTNTSKADAPPYIMSALTGGFGGTSTQPQAGGDPLGLGI